MGAVNRTQQDRETVKIVFLVDYKWPERDYNPYNNPDKADKGGQSAGSSV